MRRLLTAKEAATHLAISERALWGLTAPRGPIPVVKIGRSIRYDVADLGAWVEQQKVKSQT